jgi:hypothetical protein
MVVIVALLGTRMLVMRGRVGDLFVVFRIIETIMGVDTRRVHLQGTTTHVVVVLVLCVGCLSVK